MGVPIVPADLEAPPTIQEHEEEPPALTVGVATGVAATLDETLQHVESVGRPHDWWWALNNWRKRHVLAAFGRGASTRFEAALTSKYWLILTVALTLFCLYAVDVCDVARGGIDAGTMVSTLLLAIFIVFSLELLMASIFVDKYLLSFFFWVDLIGTASLILDIQLFAAGILNSEDSNALQITRAGRSARIGSQMGRITRVLRLVRALRLLKVLQLRKRSRQGMDPLGLGNGPIRPTVLGELLAESTTRKCVVVILFVLVVATFLQTYPSTAADYNRIQLVSYGVMTPEAFIQSAAHPVIQLSYVDALSNGRVVNFLPYTRSNMRSVMQLRTRVECAKFLAAKVEACGYHEDFSTIWYDVTAAQQLNAGLNLVLTTVIIACLGLSAYFFGRDATTYVIMPIETMLKYLKRMIMVGVDGDVESENINFRKPPETDVLANYVSRLVNEIDNARWKAEEEARISDTLLNSMVPPRIARQLKELRWWEAGPEQRAQTIADSFPQATVLFTDIVGFTVLSSRISAEDAMRHLNNMYTIFDEIVEKYGLYKVETIGDSYMLVGGAPEEREDHAERVAAAALEIRACVPLLQQISGEPGINVRIGMHSGAVTAGVVGFKNPRWHLFGDTCNTASRMESTGIAGEIQLSCTTYELIKDRFQCKVRGKIAVKGKGEMVTYLLEQEYGTDNPPEPPSGLLVAGVAAGLGPMGNSAGIGCGEAETFLSSPQFKKAMERYTTARNSFLTEEEELCKLLKSLDEPTATAAAAAAGAGQPPPPPPPSPLLHETAVATAPATATTTEAVAAAGLVVPRLAAGLPSGAFKQLVLDSCTPSDLKALALHMHEELGMARAMMTSAEEEKAAAIRRDMLLKLYARVLEAPGMALRDTFAAILDTLYKVIECDVIKMYIVDHARGQLWPVTRQGATDRRGHPQTIPVEGTLAGSAVKRARVIRVDDVAREEEFNPDLEELPAGYTSKSMMCVPVFSVSNYHHPGLHHTARLYGGGGGTAHGTSTSPTPASAGQVGSGPGDVIAVLVMVNRWTPWREAGAEEDERRIVPFAAADEASVRDAASSVGLLLMRRRGEMLLASAVPPSCLAGASFCVATLPASVARQRLRTVVRRSSVALLDARGNLWARKQEELMGQARDVLSALQRRVTGLSVLCAVGEEALLSYLVRIADEQSGGRFFNLAHSVGVLQGIYLTLRTHTELAAALGPQHLLALVLAASLLNVDRDGELLPALPTAGGTLSLVSGGVVPGGGVARTSRPRAVGASPGIATASAAGMLGFACTQSRDAAQSALLPVHQQQPQTDPRNPPPPQIRQQHAQVQMQSSSSPMLQEGVLITTSSWRNSEPGIVTFGCAGAEFQSASSRVCASPFGSSPGPPMASFKQYSGRFASGPLSITAAAAAVAALETEAATAAAAAAAASAGVAPQTAGDYGSGVENADQLSSLQVAMKAPGRADAGGAAVAGDVPAAVAPANSPDCLHGLPASVQPSTPAAGAAASTGSPPSVGHSPVGGTAAIGGGSTQAGSSTGCVGGRNRAVTQVSARRGRMAAIVDDVLSGESNILADLPLAEAAAVKMIMVTLLALRNQPATVLAMPGLQPSCCSASAGDAAGLKAEGGAGARTEPPLTVGPSTSDDVGDGTYSSSGFDATEAGVSPATDHDGTGQEASVGSKELGVLPSSPRSPTTRAALHDCWDSSQPPSGAVGIALGAGEPAARPPKAAGPPRPATMVPAENSDNTQGDSASSPGGGGRGGTAASSTGLNGPLSLAALLQAAGSDPLRLAETRTAVSALLLLTWSELLHVKDPGNALSLLQCRAMDVRTWASRLAANVSGHRRSVSLLGAVDYPVDDIQNLLLLEVPRMQLEVIPLWQRTVELLPGLQTQLDAVQANRATYVSMLQGTASPTMARSYGAVGGAAAPVGSATGAAAGQRGSAGSATTGGGSGPPSAFIKSSLLRSYAFADGAPSVRELRRFISVKNRGTLSRGALAVLPSGDSGSSAVLGCGGPQGSIATRGRVFIRASSSRSYGGRNETDEFETDGLEYAGNAAATTSILGRSAKALLRRGFGPRSFHRAASRSGGPLPPAGSRLASLVVPSSTNSAASMTTAVAATVGTNGLDTAGGGGGGGGTAAAGAGVHGALRSHSFRGQPSGQNSGLRSRSQMHELETAHSTAAATAVATSPTDTSNGQRRTSITARINHLFMSFRGSGRSTAPRPPLPNTDATRGGGGGGGGGGSLHSNAVASSPVAGAPGSPWPRPTLSSGSTPFEMCLDGYGTNDGGGAGGLASEGSQQLSLNLAAALSMAAPMSSGATPVTSQVSLPQSLPLFGGAGGSVEPFAALPPPPSPALSKPPSTVATSARRTAPAPLVPIGTGGLDPSSGRGFISAGSARPMSPASSATERSAINPSGGRLRARILRRFSYVLSKLPFHHSANGPVLGGGNAASSSSAEAARADGRVAVPMVDAEPSGSANCQEAAVALTLSDSCNEFPRPGRRLGREQFQQQSNHHSVPLPAAAPYAASLLRSGTIQMVDRPSDGSQQQQQQLSYQRLSHPQLLGEAVAITRPRRATAPSGALALAQQHEQYAAKVAAAAVAFAAKQARATAAAHDGNCPEGGANGDTEEEGEGEGEEEKEEAVPVVRTCNSVLLSLTSGRLMNPGMLPTVAEFSVSGRNSSATCTARSNSTAAPGETPKHTGTPHLSSSGVGKPMATGATAASAVATAVHPSRFGPTPTPTPAPGPALFAPEAVHAAAAAPSTLTTSSPLPSSYIASRTAGAPPTPLTKPMRASASVDASSGAASMQSLGIISASSMAAQGRTGDGAVDFGDSRVTPAHRASSKGVWLGLRLATDALRSVGRRGGGDGGGYSASTSGGLALEAGVLLPSEIDTPRLASAVPVVTTHRSGAHSGITMAPLPSAVAGTATATATGTGTAFNTACAGSSTSGSRNPSRLQTPAASLRHGVPGVGGVASLQAVIDMAEAALAGANAASCNPPFFEHRVSVGGTGPSGGPSRNQSNRRAGGLSSGQAIPGVITSGACGLGVNGGPAASVLFQQGSGVVPTWVIDEVINQRTSAPPAPSRFSLRRTPGSRKTLTDQVSVRVGQSPQPDQT